MLLMSWMMLLKTSLTELFSDGFPFAEMVYQAGFSSPSYFSISFKKYTGETPRAYKDKLGSMK